MQQFGGRTGHFRVPGPLFPLKPRGARRRHSLSLQEVSMEIDRRAFIASLGGVAAVNLMDHEAKADALEHYMEEKLDAGVAAQQPEKFPTVAEIEAQIETRPFRRGAGSVFTSSRGNVKILEKMPDKPTLHDFFRLRFAPANHVLQSATRAMTPGLSEVSI